MTEQMLYRYTYLNYVKPEKKITNDGCQAWKEEGAEVTVW